MSPKGIYAMHNALREDYTTVYPLIANLKKWTVKTTALSWLGETLINNAITQ